MIRGKKRMLDNKPAMGFDVQTGIHNRFDIEVIDARTGAIKQEARAFNIVCNYLWTCIVSRSSYFNYIFYGTGTGIPSVEDTELFGYAGYRQPNSADDTYGVDYNKGVFWYRRKAQLSETTAVGKTITEVGISSSTSAGYLCTHAMLEDMNGNPISIEKTDTDIINIYATVYVHFDARGYDGGTIKFNYWKKEYSLLTLFAGIGITDVPNYMVFTNQTTFTSTGKTSGMLSDSFRLTPGEYTYDDIGKTGSAITYSSDAAAKTLTLKAARLGATSKNLGGIRRIVLSYCYYSSGIYDDVRVAPSMIITPGGSWYPYSGITGEAIGTGDGTTTDFKFAFPFAHDAKIYVDGVIVDDVVVDYGVTTSGSIDKHVLWLDPATVSEDVLIPYYDVAPTSYVPAAGEMFYNPMYQVGLGSVYLGNSKLYASNNLKDWVEVVDKSADAAATVVIPEEFQKYKYWKATRETSSARLNSLTPVNSTGKSIHFTSPPAEGAVITADYKSDCIAKDENHVFDFSLTFHFGEYTEA